MKLLFATEAFRTECNNQEMLVKRYGGQRARLIRQRLDELFNADVLEDMRSLPHVAIHALSGGDLGVDVGKPYWLAFRPYPEQSGVAPAAEGWKKIDSIQILGLARTDAENSPKPI